MDEFYLGKGILMGIIFGVPAGAIGVLTLKNTLNRGFLSGLVTGLGSSTADLIYGVVSILGISLISDFLLKWQHPISIIAGCLILLIGILSIKPNKTKNRESSNKRENAGYFLTSFFIAIMNPATILSFLVAFAAFEIPGNLPITHCCQLIAGIVIGTVIWWLSLSGGVSILKDRVGTNIFNILQKVFAALLILFGLYILFTNTFEALRGI